jgi:hypothetical protein
VGVWVCDARRYSRSEIRFNLMAVVRNRKLQLQQQVQHLEAQEAQLRQRLGLPPVRFLLTSLSENNIVWSMCGMDVSLVIGRPRLLFFTVSSFLKDFSLSLLLA